MTSPTPRRGRPRRSDAELAAERRRVAREALRLFARHGVAGTSADDVARAAGVSVRTFWRLFPRKEDAVRPLLEDGVVAIAANVRARGLAGFRTDASSAAPPADPPAAIGEVRTLVRLTRTEPTLRSVWLDVHDDAEAVFADALAASSGSPTPDLAARAAAAVLNATLRVAVEEWAWHEPPLPPEELGRVVADAVRHAAAALEAAPAGPGHTPRPEPTGAAGVPRAD